MPAKQRRNRRQAPISPLLMTLIIIHSMRCCPVPVIAEGGSSRIQIIPVLPGQTGIQGDVDGLAASFISLPAIILFDRANRTVVCWQAKIRSTLQILFYENT
jgi:hypothetical protein